jgi:glycosyltransferase involved in cell wall biosynthesis
MNTDIPIAERSISVVLPVYNGKDYLEEAIKSVLAQTHGDFELVLSDDGSSDGSQEIMRSFSDSRIRILQPERRGLFENLNRLLRESRSPLVHILCQDDIMAPTCLEEETRFMALHPSAGMAFSKYLSIDGHGQFLSACELGDLPALMPPMLTLQCLFYHGCIPGNLSTVCIRRACLDVIGSFNASFGVSADYEMWMRLGQRWDMGVCHKHLLSIRLHDKQLSHARSSGLAFVQQNRRICMLLLPLLPEEIRVKAQVYDRRRHCVRAVHFGMRSLLGGESAALLGVVRALGAAVFLRAFFFWLITMNNRLWTPAWHFVLPESNSGVLPGRSEIRPLPEREGNRQSVSGGRRSKTVF